VDNKKVDSAAGPRNIGIDTMERHWGVTMPQKTKISRSTSDAILALQAGMARDFIKQQVAQRSFSKTVAALNRELLTGTPAECARARQALTRLGFADV
jgi:hypothetical protein